MEVHEKIHETFHGSPWSSQGLPWNISWTSMKFHEKLPENFLKHPPLQYLTVVRAEPAPSRIVVDAILCPSSALREKPGGRTQQPRRHPPPCSSRPAMIGCPYVASRRTIERAGRRMGKFSNWHLVVVAPGNSYGYVSMYTVVAPGKKYYVDYNVL